MYVRVCVCICLGATHAHWPADGVEKKQEERKSWSPQGGGATQEIVTPEHPAVSPALHFSVGVSTKCFSARCIWRINFRLKLLLVGGESGCGLKQ